MSDNKEPFTMTQPSSKDVPSSARIAKLLGQLSLVAVVLSLFIGFMVEMVGVNSLFFSFAIPLSLSAIIVSIIVRRDIGRPESPGYKEAVAGQRMGLIALGIMLFIVIAVAVFFTLVFWGR
jgi:uncharacterized membrane protein